MSQTQTMNSGASGQPTGEGANPSTQQSTIPATPSSQNDPWAALDADSRAYIEKNGYKDVSALVRSDMGLRSMLGADKASLLRVPREGRAENPTAWAEVDRALGVPQDGKYGDFKPSQGDLAASADQLTKFDAFMHRAGASPAARNAALEAFHEINREVVAEMQGQLQQAKAEADAANRQLWGAAYTRKMMAAETGLNGVDGAAELDALLKDAGLGDHPAVFRVKAAIAEMRGEEGLPQGGGAQRHGGGGGVLSPKEAQAKVDSLFADQAWTERYGKGDPAAVKELTELYEMVAARTEG